MDALLKEFQKFWRRNGELWEAKADYTEAFPHLLLMAFLQRVVNGGGRIEREYAAGRGQGGPGGGVRRLMVDHRNQVCAPRGRQGDDGRGGPRADGPIPRTDRPCLPRLPVVFDRTSAGRRKSWEERLGWEVRETAGVMVTLVGG